METTLKRFLSMVLAFTMVLSYVPVQTFADDGGDDIMIVANETEGTQPAECSHSYASEVTTAATCTTDGLATYTCSACGDRYTKTVVASGHNYEVQVTTAATCADKGEQTHTCSVCGDTYTSEVAALGHSYAAGACSVCGKADPDAQAEDPTETTCKHDYVAVEAVAPTCTAAGSKVTTCSKCGDSSSEEIAATGHNFVDGVCACGEPEKAEEEPEEDEAVKAVQAMIDALPSEVYQSQLEELQPKFDAAAAAYGALTEEQRAQLVNAEKIWPGEIIDDVSVAFVGNQGYATLQEALDAAAAASGKVTVEIIEDIDLSNVDWKPVTVSEPHYPEITVEGKGKTITGLNDMLFAGTWAGSSSLIIKNLTIADSEIVNDKDDTKGNVGVGAFIGFPQASATITLENCHLVDSIVEGGHWTGGLIGYAAGYAGNDGPVFMNLTIKDCSVTESTITGKGSAGGVIGHGSGNGWTKVVIENTDVCDNTITSTGSSTNKAGAVMGTIGAAGQATTVNGVEKIGGAFVAATVSGNTVSSNGTTITTIYGRQGTETGTLEITGGSYDANPIEKDVSYAYPAEGYVIVKNADGTYGLGEMPAEVPVAKVGNVEYAAIDEAIANWTNNSTLTLLADVTLSDVITLKSTEHHILDLGTYTMTAAEGKNAFVIQACGTGDAERTAITIKADATNPGGINAGKGCIVYYKYADGGINGNDRPIIKIEGGVFTGSTSSWGTAGIYTIGSAARQCATLNISGGTFNCTINGSSKSKLLISGGTFNYSVGSQGDSTALRLISGGKFKTLGFMTADSNNTKFWFGTSMANSNVGLYVDREGYLVVGGPVITELSQKYPAVASNPTKWSSYLNYSSAATYGLFYEDAAMAIAKHGGENVTVWVKPSVTIPDDVTGDPTVVEEIKNNTALKDYTPENLPTGAELEIALVSVGETVVYDVTPMANGAEVEPTEAITFRLPVPASVSKTLAKVYHEEELLGTYKINGEDNGKYVEISSPNFSNFTVEPVDTVAKIGDKGYATLIDAINAVNEGDTIVLTANEIFTVTNRTHNSGTWYDGVYYVGDKSFTIDLGGFTISQDGSVNDYLLNFKNVGGKENTIIIKNGTVDAGTTAFCALCTSATQENQLTINLEDVHLINNISNGSTVKIRGGVILNMNDGAKITGENSYLGIENYSSTVNIYDGAEIYMNGTSSYNGCLAGVAYGGTINVYGGYGKGVKGGFIAMTSGGTINISGGEWIANTDGTVGNNSNLYVLTAQSNKYESGFVGASIINVTGGTFRGGMDAWVLNNIEGEKAELNISGGNFNANPKSYLLTGYGAELKNGIYTVERALSGDGSKTNPYTIGSLEELILFRDKVNAGNSYEGKYVKLTADIDLDNEAWTPIFTFNGTFDGDNHTISNLVINGGSESNQGFFGQTNNGEIKNVTFKNAKVSGRLNVGVVAGTPYTSKYTNVKVTGHVEVTGMAYVGGVGGKNAYADWTDITVDVDSVSYVQANSVENGTAYRTYVGGVVGFNGEGSHTFKNISSNIKVIGSTKDIGGLFGIAHYGNNFENVTFTGSVEAPEGATEVGGIAGVWHNTDGSPVTFTKATSTGTVTVGEVTTTGTVVGGAYTATSDAGSLVIDGIKTWPVIAKIGDQEFGDLQAAVNAAKDGDTITLLKDITVTEPAYGQNALNHARAVSFTLDLNGKTLSADTGNSVFRFNISATEATSDVTVTVKNGKVISGANTWCALMALGKSADAKAILNLENLTVEGSKAGDLVIKAWENSVVNATNVTVNATNGAGGFYAVGGEIVLDNCTVNQKGLHTAPYLSMAIAVSDGGTMTVNSGTYSAEPTAAAEGVNQGSTHGSWVGGVMNSGGTLIINGGTFANGNFGDDSLATAARGLIMADTGAVVEINGGTFNALKNIFDIQNNKGDANKQPSATVYGGTFSANPTVGNYSHLISVGYGLKVKQNSDGTYGVVSAIEAKVGTRYYETLEAALAAAQDGSVIELMANITADVLTVSKNVTIRCYDNTLSCNAIYVKDGKELTLNGNVVCDVYADTVTGGAKINGVAITGIQDEPSKLKADGTLSNPDWAAKIGTEYYMTLAEAVNAAQAGDTVTVFAGTYAVPSMKAGITIQGEGDVLLEGTLTGTLENLTLKNLHIKGGNAQRWAYAKGNLVFENVTFEATSVYALHFDGISEGANLLYKDCTIIGWAAMGGTPASCVFDGCTIKGNGTYGVIRTYFDATIKDCAFDVANVNSNDNYEDGIHAVEGAKVTVNNCTNANGEMADLVNVHATSVVILDGENIQNVAKIGNTYYRAIDEALAAAKSGDTIELVRDYTVAKGETIELNGVNLTAGEGITLTNNGAIEVYGEVTLNIAKLAGSSSIDVMHNAILKNISVGGNIFIAGEVTFRGNNTVALVEDYGDAYSDECSHWTVEAGASLTMTEGSRYGLGYGDKATIKGNLTDATSARASLTDADRSAYLNGGIAMMDAWDVKNYLTVEDAYVVIGVNNSFGTKGDYGTKGEFIVNFDNTVLDSSRVTVVKDGGEAFFTFNKSDAKVGAWHFNQATSTASFVDSYMLVTGNGTNYNNVNAGKMTLTNSDIEFQSGAFTNNGAIEMDINSSITTPELAGTGKIVIDATGYVAGTEVTLIDGDVSAYTGTIEVLDNNLLEAVKTEAGIVLRERKLAENENGELVVDGLEALKLFRDQVNAGNTFSGKTVKLTADINLASVENWTPIGNSSKRFKGTFDGGNHTISNLVVNADTNNAGLFGFASVIKNVTINNAKVSGVVCVGALAGELESSVGTVENCHVTGTIQITGENSVGGLVGKGYANIGNSSVTGNADSFVLGVYGNTEEGDNIGGLMGHLGEGNTLGVSNSSVANITVKGTRKVGGLIGTTARANDYVGNTVKDVTVECTATADYAEANASTATIGGIIGNYFGSATSGGVLQNNKVENVTFLPGNAKSAGVLVGGDRVNNGGAPVGIEASGNTASGVTGATNNYMFAAEVNGVPYETLQAAINAAQAGDTVTVFAGTYAVPSMKAGITIQGEGKVLLEGTLTGTLENLTLKNLHIKGGNAQRWAYAKGDLVFENVTFEATSVYALHFDGISEGANLLYKDCTIIGWAAMGGTPASCVFDGCTIKGNGTYGVIRTYFDATIEDCTFDVANVNSNDNYEDGIHAVEGAKVTVNNCTNANGEMADLVNVHATSVVILDGKNFRNVAKIGNTYYETIGAALAAAQVGDTVTIMAGDYTQNLDVNKAITVVGETDAEGKNLVNVNGKLNITADGAAVKNINFNNGSANAGYISAKNVLVEGCTVVGGNGFRSCYTTGNVTFKDSTITGGTYGIHFDGNAGGNIVIDNCVITGWSSFAATITNVAITDTEFKSGNYNVLRFYQNAEVTNTSFPSGMRIDSGSGGTGMEGITLKFTNCTSAGDETLYDIIPDSVLAKSAVYERETRLMPVCAKIDDTEYRDLQEAVNEADGKTITLVRDITLTEGVVVEAGKTITLDLNGHNITGTPAEAAAYAVITNKGDLTITGNGTILCNHTLAGSTGYAVNTITNLSKLTIDGATIKNVSEKGGQIGYAIDNNSGIGNAILTIKNGEVTASGSNYYDGIRQFCNSVDNENSVTVNGGEVSSIWVQNPSDGTEKNTKDVKGNVTITGGEVGALYLEPSSAFTASITGGYVGSISEHDTNENETRIPSGFITGGTFGKEVEKYLAEGYSLTFKGGVFMVETAKVAIVNGKIYGSVQAAIDAANNATVYLQQDVTLKNTLTVPAGKTVTLDLNGKTVSYTSDVLGTLMITNHGDLTITDSVGEGKITYCYTGESDQNTKTNATIENFGKLTVASGIVENTTNVKPLASYAIDTREGATLNVAGGQVLNLNGHAIRQVSFGTAANTVNISGGYIEGTRALQFQLPGSAGAAAPEMTLNISGGELKSNEETYNLAVYVYSGGQSAEKVKVTISDDAVLNGNVAIYDASGEMAEGAASVTGGTLNGAYGIFTYAEEDSNNTISIVGGIFATNYSEMYAKDDGKAFEQNENGTYGVVDKKALTGSIRLSSAALNLLDKISIVYKASDDLIATKDEDVAERGIFLYDTAEKATKKNPADAYETVQLTWNAKESKYIGQTAGIDARDMAKSQFAVAYVKLIDGTYIFGTSKGNEQTIEYSPLIYSRNKMNDANMGKLCRALMQYGAAAQVAQYGMTSGLMNEGFAEIPYDANVLGTEVFSVNATVVNGMKLNSAALNLEGTISYIIKFTVEDANLANKQLYAEYNLLGENSSVELVTGADGKLWAVIAGIPAKDLDATIKVKAYYLDDNGEKVYGGELVYSAYEYVRRTVRGTGTETNKNLAKALAMYIYYADDYAARN